jgi:hypothetical protein
LLSLISLFRRMSVATSDVAKQQNYLVSIVATMFLINKQLHLHDLFLLFRYIGCEQCCHRLDKDTVSYSIHDILVPGNDSTVL